MQPEKPAPVFKPVLKPTRWEYEDVTSTTSTTTTTTTTSAPTTVKKVMKLLTEETGDDGYLTDVGYMSDEPVMETRFTIDVPPTAEATTAPYDPLNPFEVS